MRYKLPKIVDMSGAQIPNMVNVGSGPKAAGDQPLPRVTHRILLVATDGAIREGLRKVLEAANYEVLQAHDGQEAKAVSGNRPIHLLIMDLDSLSEASWRTMEGLTDFDPMLPVIVLAGFLDQPEMNIAAHIGAMLEKPVDVPVLMHYVDRLIAETRDERWARLAPFVSQGPWQGSPATRILKQLRQLMRVPELPYRGGLAAGHLP